MVSVVHHTRGQVGFSGSCFNQFPPFPHLHTNPLIGIFSWALFPKTLTPLPQALLDDDEFSMGLDGWKAKFGDLFLFGGAKGGGEEDEEEGRGGERERERSKGW